jgi:hypothetical protein
VLGVAAKALEKCGAGVFVRVANETSRLGSSRQLVCCVPICAAIAPPHLVVRVETHATVQRLKQKFPESKAMLYDMSATTVGAVGFSVPACGAPSRRSPNVSSSWGDSPLRVAKAEGRPPGIEGSVFRYRDVDNVPTLTPAPVVARIGAALRAVRTQRQLSQSDLGRLAG